MEEKSPSKSEEKPFSVLERFRQLKKEKEQPGPAETSVVAEAQDSSGTVFQASTSSPTAQNNGEFRRSDGFRGGRGRHRGKRSFNDNAGERPSKRPAPELHQGQREPDVGITEFISDIPGFDVIIKHRYTDFHVNEIDKEGHVVKLTSTEIPENDEGSETVTEEEDPTILTPEQWSTLRDIVEKELPDTLGIDVTDFDKDKRQRIHKAVKRRFGVQVFSNTGTVDNKKIMQIGCASGQKNCRYSSWPRGRPEFLHFVLYKEHCDTTEAVNTLAKVTVIRPNKFGYAGTKDKRAVTTQQMCLRRRDVEKFKACSRLRGLVVGNYAYKWSNLRLGDLNGNRFKIALRNVKASDEVIKNAFESFQKNGFINYFGLQRFGQSALVPTYSIGKAILKGDWKLATELLLKPRLGESCYRDVKEAREVWWKTRDANEALKSLVRKDKSIEGKILLGLKKHGPNAYQNAFDNIPRHTVTLYLHSYQSLIWNKVVSRRIKKFGLKVLPGDLVIVNPEAVDKEAAMWQENTGACGHESDEEDETEEGCEARTEVRVLSAEEAEAANIEDIVYPLPGDDIRYPDNEVADWYTELLEEDGYSKDSFCKVNKKYGMYGTYRRMIERAEQLEWRTVQYSSPDEDLIVSDWDILKGKPPLVQTEGPYKAVIVEFNLKVCCYATMAIRELTRCETSTSNQAMLTNRAREEDLAIKKQREEELRQKMEVESIPEDNVREQCINCDMETEAESGTPPAQNTNGDADEEGEMNMREAEADNIINKYLESKYH